MRTAASKKTSMGSKLRSRAVCSFGEDRESIGKRPNIHRSSYQKRIL